MWNMRSPPFRYSITKNRCDWNRKLKNIIPHVKAGVIIGYEKKLLLTSVWKVQKRWQRKGCFTPRARTFRSIIVHSMSSSSSTASFFSAWSSITHMMRFQDQVADLDCIVVLTASQLCQQNFAKAGERGGDQVGEDGRGLLTFPFLTLGGIWSPSLHTSWKTDDTLWAPRFSDSWTSLPFHHHQNRSSRPAVPETDFWRNRWNLREKAVRGQCEPQSKVQIGKAGNRILSPWPFSSNKIFDLHPDVTVATFTDPWINRKYFAPHRYSAKIK